MSHASPIVSLRFPPLFLAAMEEARQKMRGPCGEVVTRTHFIQMSVSAYIDMLNTPNPKASKKSRPSSKKKV